MPLQKFKEICKNCGCTLGAHSGTNHYSKFYKMHIPQNYCPGHEGRMDWNRGPGTCFKPTREYRENKECN